MTKEMLPCFFRDWSSQAVGHQSGALLMPFYHKTYHLNTIPDNVEILW
jgi:hypothetical protein